MIAIGIWSEAEHEKLQKEIEAEVMKAQKEAESFGSLADGHLFSNSTMFDDIYKDVPDHLRRQRPRAGSLTMAQMTMIQALRSAMDVMLARNPDVVVFGEDVGYFGGVFRCTEGCNRNTARRASSIRRSPRAASSASRSAWAPTVCGPWPRSSSPTISIPASDQLVVGSRAPALPLAGGLHLPRSRSACPAAAASTAGRRTARVPRPLFTPCLWAADRPALEPLRREGLLISSIENDDPVIFLEPKRIYNGPFDGHHDKPVVPWSKHPTARCPRATTPCRSSPRRCFARART
jgi:hypothetical protein